MEVYGIIYLIKNIINNKVYIGQTTRNTGFKGRYRANGIGIERVFNYYIKEKERKGYYNKHLLNSIEKYGFNNFIILEVYDFAFSQDELDKKEDYYIKLFDSQNNKYGYNNKGGGNNGKSSKETNKKSSIAKLGWDIESEKDGIINAYLTELKTLQEIADIYNVSETCIWNNLKKWSIKPIYKTRSKISNQNGNNNPSARIVEVKNIINNNLYTFKSINDCISWMLENNIINKQSDWKHKVYINIKNKTPYKEYLFFIYSKKEYENYKNAS